MRNVLERLDDQQERLEQQAEYIREVDDRLIDLWERLIQVSQRKFGDMGITNLRCCSWRTSHRITVATVRTKSHWFRKDPVHGCYSMLICN